MVLYILVTFARNRCTAGCGASRGFEYPKSLFPMGLVSPLKERSIGTHTHFLLGRSHLHPVPFSGCLFRGLTLEEPFGRLYPIQPNGGYIPNAFATNCRPNACSLPRMPGYGVAVTLQRLAERHSPSASVYPAVPLSGHSAFGFHKYLFKSSSLATISFGIGIWAIVRPGMGN